MATPTCWESGFTEFKLDFEGTKNLAIGDIVCSDDFSAGGHVWRVNCYPHGDKGEHSNGVYLSLYLYLVSGSKDVKAIFDAFLVGRDGKPSSSHGKRCVQVYPPEGFQLCGCEQFVKRSVLESDYVMDGLVTFMVGVIVLQLENPIPVPASDIASHLGGLLDHADDSDDDVTFSVGGETFHARRAVLAARSAVFKALLFGSMAETKMRCITLHDIKPATFQIMLQFMCTDELPKDEEIQSCAANIELFQDLLVAADMYQLDRLKLMCARKLWECVSWKTVASVLGCAELHNCPELKRACIDFFVVEENFMVAVLTDGYFQLMQSSPSIIDEIRARRQI